MIQTTTLPNGLTVASDSFEHVETVALGVWLNIGARHETKAENGIAHMLEHMAFKGTTNRSALDISKVIEDVGGYMNAYTSREMTAYYVRLLKKDVALGVDIISDILQNSSFDEAEFSREQGVVIQEIGRSNDTPDDVVFDYFQETAYGDHPMGWPILGSKKIIENLKAEQVKSYLERHYGVHNMVLCASGNVDHDELCKLAEKYFTKVTDKGNQTPLTASYQGGDYRKQKDLEQIHVVMGFPTVGFFDDYYYDYLVLASIMGGGMSSRLFQEIREKRGLVYTISADQYSFSDGGLLSVYAGTSPEKVGELIPVVADEFKKACNSITPEELQRVKNQMQAGLLMGLESTANRAERLARQMAFYKKPISMEDILSKIEQVNLQRLHSICTKTLMEKPTLTTLGNLAQVPSYESFENLLKAG